MQGGVALEFLLLHLDLCPGVLLLGLGVLELGDDGLALGGEVAGPVLGGAVLVLIGDDVAGGDALTAAGGGLLTEGVEFKLVRGDGAVELRGLILEGLGAGFEIGAGGFELGLELLDRWRPSSLASWRRTRASASVEAATDDGRLIPTRSATA
jgi:hypothetical protein